MSPKSALPDFYYFCFGAYEPFLTMMGFLGSLADPLTAHNSQAPWSTDVKPYEVLPTATLVTMIQLAHVCSLLGVVNLFLLSAVRRHMKGMPALQEKILFALFTPLLLGDIFHMGLTLWALGDQKWNILEWKSAGIWALGATLIAGMGLFNEAIQALVIPKAERRLDGALFSWIAVMLYILDLHGLYGLQS